MIRSRARLRNALARLALVKLSFDIPAKHPISGQHQSDGQYASQVQASPPQLSTPPMIMSRASSVNAAPAGIEGAPG
jgi:hypothetical protein